MDKNDSSSRLVTKDDLNALTKTVIALTQSLTTYVYEMSKHDEDTYNSRRENFGDVDYIAQEQDCHYIPLLEDEIDNHYISNQYQEVNQPREQYFDDTSSNLIYNPMEVDEEQEEPTLAQLMSQMLAIQAQQGKEIQLLTYELQQEMASLKILEMRLVEQAASSSYNPEKFPLQLDVRPANTNVITLKSEKVFKEPEDKERVSIEVVEEEKFEQGNVNEVIQQETPYVAPSAYVPPIPFPHLQIKVSVATFGDDNVIDVCKLTFDESEVLSDKHAENSDTVGSILNEVVKKSFHEGPEILICNTRLKDETTMSLPGH